MKKIIPLALLAGIIPFTGCSRIPSYAELSQIEQVVPEQPVIERQLIAAKEIPRLEYVKNPLITGDWKTILDYLTQFAHQSTTEDVFFYDKNGSALYDVGAKEQSSTAAFSIDECIDIVREGSRGIFYHAHNHHITGLDSHSNAKITPLEIMLQAVPSFVDMESYLELQNRINMINADQSKQPSIEFKYLVINPLGRTETTINPGTLDRKKIMKAYSEMVSAFYYREDTFGNQDRAEATFKRLARRLEEQSKGIIVMSFFWNK